MFGAFLARQSAAQPSQARQAMRFWCPAQPSTAQPSPAHSPAQPSPPHLAQPSPHPAQPAQLSSAHTSPAQPKTWCGPCRAQTRPSPAQPRPAQALVCALPKHCQRPLLTGFRCGVFRRHRFWSVFGSFGAAVPLRLAVLGGSMFGAFLARQSAAQPSQACQAMPRPSPAPAQPSPAQPSPAQPSPPHLSPPPRPASPHQPISSVQPKPPQPRPKPWCGALPNLCQRLFLILDSDVAFSAHRRHRFWSVFGLLGPPCRCVSLS